MPSFTILLPAIFVLSVCSVGGLLVAALYPRLLAGAGRRPPPEERPDRPYANGTHSKGEWNRREPPKAFRGGKVARGGGQIEAQGEGARQTLTVDANETGERRLEPKDVLFGMWCQWDRRFLSGLEHGVRDHSCGWVRHFSGIDGPPLVRERHAKSLLQALRGGIRPRCRWH